MKREVKYVFLLLVNGCLGLGCNQFLDVEPDSNTSVELRSVETLQQILNNQNLGVADYLLADLAADEFNLEVKTLKASPNIWYVRAYNWDKEIWSGEDIDMMYDHAYKMIRQMNIVLVSIEKVRDGTAEQRERIKGEALVNRAYYYLQLVNLYGPAYRASTAVGDLAVPLVLQPDSKAKPVRASMEQVYRQIEQDLHTAASMAGFPDLGIEAIHPGKASAWALLARTYLLMSRYPEAMDAANSVLKINSNVLDLRLKDKTSPGVAMMDTNPFMLLKLGEQNPEVLYARIGNPQGQQVSDMITLYLDQSMGTLLEKTDLRKILYTSPPESYLSDATPGSHEFSGINPLVYRFQYSIGVPEMLLIKAEALARQGDANGALAQLELIRKFRFKASHYKILQNKGADVALQQVLDERRRELFAHGGLRLFDLKRLNLENRFKKDLERRAFISGKAYGAVISTLGAGSSRYLFPFAPGVLAGNANMVQNDRTN